VPAISLFAALDRAPDVRSPGGRRHRLQAVLALAVGAMPCGSESLYAIAPLGRDHADDLAGWLGFGRHGPPRVATLHRALKHLDVARFEAAPADWLQAAVAATPPARREPVALGGKVRCGSRGHQPPGVHLLAAFSHRLGLPPAQAPVPPDTNEAKAAPPLLRCLVPEGTVVTGDAIFCQREVCAEVVGHGGDYVLGVKGNRPSLREATATPLPDAPPPRPSRRPPAPRRATGSSGGG
jgi:DDE_Tnp_1-associated/Transposase DDE domain